MKTPPPLPTVVNTNVKQGAVIGGWVCFAIGMLLMLLSLWAFIIYGPLLLVAFILSIVAMSQGRIAGGVSLLLCCLIVPPIAIVGLVAARSEQITKLAAPSAASPAPTVIASPSPATVEIPKAVSLDEIINNAKKTVTPEMSAQELRDAKTELLKVPRTSGRYREVQEILSRLDRYLDAALKAEEKAARRAASSWTYYDRKDEMGRGVAKYAEVTSTNELSFHFPYSGEQHAKLTIRSHPKHGKDVIVTVERGQFLCAAYNGCRISIRFDEGAEETFSGRGASDGDPKYLFITPYDKFVSQMRKARQVRIEAEFYQEATRVMQFDVADFDG
ncbi:MAG: hypothetical protein V7609_609 [Verrucomicrobiota bacterium]